MLGKGMQGRRGGGAGGQGEEAASSRTAQRGSRREEAGRQAGRQISGRASGAPWFALHPQGLAQSRHTSKGRSLESADDKDCGPTNASAGAYLISPSFLTLGGRYDS